MINDGYMRAHAEEHLCGIGADHARADDNDFRRWNTRHTAHQYSLAALVVLKQACRDLSGHCAADLAERMQNRQRTIFRPDLFICNGRHFFLEQNVNLILLRRGKMQETCKDGFRSDPIQFFLQRPVIL